MKGKGVGGSGGGIIAEEEEEEHHRNPFFPNTITATTKLLSPKIQFRKDISKAKWQEDMGMAEILEKKGSIWATTGVVRDSKLYCHIEEIFNSPPSRLELENLEKSCGNVPLRICYVDHGRVSFFSCDQVLLPALP